MSDAEARPLVSRRQCLKLLASGLAAGFVIPHVGSDVAAAQKDTTRPETDGLTVRVVRPVDAETPVSEFASFLTPNHRFFVRSHFGPPDMETIEESRWRLTVGGAVERPRVFTMNALRQLETVTITSVLQCSGNGRAYHRPRVPGVQWERGAVGNAQWTGVRLRDVLQSAGVRTEGRHVQFQGADRPAVATVPLFVRSIPLKKALHPDTILAYEMNGQALPLLHGAPLRVITPGWMAESCIKWLTDIVVREDEASGYYMQTAYRVPTFSSTSGAGEKTQTMVPVEVMPVKSLIVSPTSGENVKVGPVTIHGVAWGGKSRVAKVELSMDEGKRWEPARLLGDAQAYAWRQWQFAWPAKVPGTFQVVCRATDEQGSIQPAITAWNPSGFLWNGWDRITVQVNA
ncbi:MAG TPA: sulfite oxidase [Nitrospira sp.]|nr:sulfite oxidase [Nitrospira sp.]